MAYEELLKSISLDADSSLGIYTGVPGQPGSAVPNSGKQYTFVKVTGEHQVGLATAAGDVVVGVMQNKPQKAGAAATVAISGVTNLVAGAAVSAGVSIVSDGTGRGIPKAATPSGGKQLIALTIAAGFAYVLTARGRLARTQTS